jgi:hypothetical protein
MAVYKRGKIWWYKFNWNGKTVRESTKQTNKRVAEQMEAADKTSLAKGEVGIRERKPAPTVAEFSENDFMPHVRARFADKPATLAYYQIQVKHLTGYSPLAGAAVDAITPEIISGFVEKWRAAEYEVSSINRALQVLRRMLRLAVEWGKVEKAAPRISLLPGERRRERVLSPTEEAAYLKATQQIGESILEAYERALEGIRATAREEQPIKPDDPTCCGTWRRSCLTADSARRNAIGFVGSTSGTMLSTFPSARRRTRGGPFRCRIARRSCSTCGNRRRLRNGSSRHLPRAGTWNNPPW